MKKIQTSSMYLKFIVYTVLVGIFVLPLHKTNAVNFGSYYSANGFTSSNSSNDPFAFTAENAALAFDSVIGCTITTESISNTISKVLTKGQKFGAKVNSRFQEIFNSNKDDEVNFTLEESDADRFYWKAGGDEDTVSALERFSKATSYLDSVPVSDQEVNKNTGDAVDEQEELNKKSADQLKELETQRVRQQCLDGVAYTLAKRQLTKITSDTLAWVNTGLGGDPLFVRDQTSYLQNIADQKLFEFLSPLASSKNLDKYPYGRDFARGALTDRSTTFEQRSATTMSQYLPSNTSVDDWSNDFSSGGWNAWLGFTQNPANNPLGYQMIATEELNKRKNQAVETALDEISQGNGFLPEKECVEWTENGVYSTKDSDGRVIEIDYNELAEIEKELGSESGGQVADEFFEGVDPLTADGSYQCLRWEIITPGSVIENQVNTTLTSAVRQLELADSLNESLSILFRSLLNNLMTKGLRNLDQNMFLGVQTNNGFSINTLYNSYGDISLLPGYNSSRDILNVNRGGGFNSGDFDLTIDLGDITGTIYYEGCTDLSGRRISCVAQNNPLDYYSLHKIILDECSDGIDNDKDGLFDADDPTCALKNTGIVKKGLITIQKEYIQAVKESQAELPKIMPALGELDYCIPGPNPSWRSEILEEVNASVEFIRSMSVEQDGTIKSIYGEMAELDKQFAESKAGNGLATAGRITQTVGSAFGPVGTVIGAVVGTVFNLKAQDKAETARVNYYNAIELKQRYLFDTQYNFEKQKKDGITKLIKTFTSYENDYERLYGPSSPMRTAPSLFDKNNYYLPMANAGLALTEHMSTYARNIDKADSDYEELKAEADANIYTLEEIRKKVDTIVLRARNRRADDIKTGKLVIPPECQGLVDLGIPRKDYVDTGGTGQKQTGSGQGL